MSRNATPATLRWPDVTSTDALPSLLLPQALPIPKEQGTSVYDLYLSRAGRLEMINPMMEMTLP